MGERPYLGAVADLAVQQHAVVLDLDVASDLAADETATRQDHAARAQDRGPLDDDVGVENRVAPDPCPGVDPGARRVEQRHAAGLQLLRLACMDGSRCMGQFLTRVHAQNLFRLAVADG